jgi:methylmalonyl-CoA/ethylmalonyl-CoA epimerase
MIKRVDHVGVVVSDLEKELMTYDRIFGLRPVAVKTTMGGKLRVAFVRAGDSEIELLQPLDPNISFGRVLQSRGPSIHHIAMETDDIEAEIERMKKEGVTFDTEKPRIGAHGVKIIFTKPETTGGVAVELCQTPLK